MQRRTWIRSFFILGTLLAIAPVAAAQDGEAGGINIREVQVGTALEGGLVASPTTSISRTAGRIFAVIRLDNPSRAAGTIQVSLEPVGGPQRGGFTLDIPARPRYRTVARFGASHPPGQYRIVIRNEAGAELESVTITITE
ncbi:MAG: hypothetical protein H6719_21925 [Sandaracinaceae bacterium]|nr:hypothetical protein [Sandaracinaceae bacterium]